MRHWLMKSEPDVYSIDDLARDGKTGWEGVRNAQARNSMRDDMRVGDLVLFYHSNAEPSGVAGVAVVSRPAHPDPSQFDPSSPYHDPKSRPAAPTWLQVELSFVARFPRFVPLATLRDDPALAGIPVARKGQRLSVMPIDPAHFAHVCATGGWAPAGGAAHG